MVVYHVATDSVYILLRLNFCFMCIHTYVGHSRFRLLLYKLVVSRYYRHLSSVVILLNSFMLVIPVSVFVYVCVYDRKWANGWDSHTCIWLCTYTESYVNCFQPCMCACNCAALRQTCNVTNLGKGCLGVSHLTYLFLQQWVGPDESELHTATRVLMSFSIVFSSLFILEVNDLDTWKRY